MLKNLVIAKFLIAFTLLPQLSTQRVFSKQSVADQIDVGFLVQHWERKVDELSKIGGVEVSSYPDQLKSAIPIAEPNNVSTLQVDGAYALKKIVDQSENPSIHQKHTILVNSKYLAIVREIGGVWMLDEVILASDSQYQTMVNEFVRGGPSLGVIFEIALFDDLRSCKDSSISSMVPVDDSGARFKVTFKNVGENLKRVEFIVTEKREWLPETVFFQHKDSARLAEFSEWTTFDGMNIPTKFTSEIPSGFKGEGLTATYRTRFDVVDRKPNKSECFLTHYGLLEPKTITNSSFYYVVTGTLLILAIGVCLYLRRAM